MGRVSGKVALITGAARGQGRAHAVRLAEEGADIVAVDVCGPVDTVEYPLPTPEDLVHTAKLVEEHDRRVRTHEVDVRDFGGLQGVVADTVEEFGGIDVLVANAGIFSVGRIWEITEEQWRSVLDVNLTGVWNTAKAAIPAMIEGGRGGSIILTSSMAGLLALPNIGHYVTAKHGVVGLMRALAVELAPYNIRVNTVNPTTVDTDMIHNDMAYKLFMPGVENPSREMLAEGLPGLHSLNTPWIETADVSNMILFLASDEARYITGTTQMIDAGLSAPMKLPHS